MRRFTAAAVVIALWLTMSACGDDAEGPNESGEYPVEELIIGLPAPNQVYSAAYVAIEQGFFADENLEAEIVVTQSSSASIQQAASGSVHIGAATPDAAIFGISQGARVSIVAVTIEGSPLSLVAGRDVTGWEDLRGTTIGVSALKGGEIALLRRLLATKGLQEGDYDVIVSGATPAKAAALAEGSVAAAVLFSPSDYALQDEGFNILGSTAELPLADQIPLTVYAINDRWAATNDRGLRFARAIVRANQWLQDPANRDRAVEIFAGASNQQPQHVAATFELWFDDFGIGTPYGGVTAAEIQNTINMMAADGDLTEPLPSPEDFFDASYIEAAVAELGLTN